VKSTLIARLYTVESSGVRFLFLFILIVITIIIEVFFDESTSIYLVFRTYILLYYSETLWKVRVCNFKNN